MSKNNAATLLFPGLLVFFLLFLFYQCNDCYKKLSGPEGRITVAHVYKKDTVGKGDIYYYYIYKVDNNYFASHTAGSNVKDLHTFVPQCFLVAYYQHYPVTHSVLWSYRFDSLVPLGTALDTLHFDRSLIKKHTLGWHGQCPEANYKDSNAMKEYESRTGKKLE